MELIARIHAFDISRNVTPFGDDCIRANGPLHNFAERVNQKLPGRYHLEYGQVGPKGAWGYRLVD